MFDEMVPNWHFTFLWEGVLPVLREAGVSDEQITTMLEDNPRGWLTS
jgi:phosphotriesterase-related protein